MEKNEYQIMYNIEDDYWWYAGLHHLILAIIRKKFSAVSLTRALDAGCGTGALLQKLTIFPYSFTGFDIAQEALKFCRKRKLPQLLQASIHEIPFQNDSFNLVISMDVLCNLSKQDMTSACQEIYRVLDKNGLFVFNLPAYEFLKSTHDKAVHLQHRFVKHRLQQQLQSLKFTIHYLTYRNTVLFPALALVRLFKKIKSETPGALLSDLKPLPSWINRLLTTILLVENSFLLRGGLFPFGLSLFGVAQKA